MASIEPTEIPPHLNARPIVLAEDNFVCPRPSTFTDVFGKIRPNFVRVEDKRLGVNIQKGDKVALKNNRRRLLGYKLGNFYL